MKLTLHNATKVAIYAADVSTRLEIPYMGTSVQAGFPSPADDFLEGTIDLNKELIKNKSATFFVRAKGSSMKEAGIKSGDLLIVDKSIEAKNGNIAVCFIDGDFTVKRIKIEMDCIYLLPANSDFNPIKVTSENDFVIWGVVTNVIKSL